ncbi:MAG TPA: TonB-dependent receptor plug domain-containing protein, partial [Chitinophagaceae bacterium]
FVKEITLQKVIAPRLLMKLDFPQKGYGAGDEVTADFSMRNLSDKPVRNYPASYTISIGGTVVQNNTFKTDNEGKSQLKFNLPAALKTNDGLLNITIRYDSYTEAISRSIPIVLNKIDLQFMPEGGTFVEGISTHVAFRALNENGKPVDIKGEIWDSRGNKITAFESYRFGMGSFPFTPQEGRSYKVKIITPANITQQYELPAAGKSGLVMNASRTGETVTIKLISTERAQITLVGETKNTPYYSKDLLLKKGETLVTLNERSFPMGIARFTVYADGRLPISERLLFLNEDRHLQVSISTDKQKYLPREKVKLSIKTTDENGRPVPSNLSLSVIDDKLWSFADDKQDHILSWLLMSSELKGKIEEPAFYFKKEEPQAIPALDLVMLTHGYRYFDYIPYARKEGDLKFAPDQPNMLSGMILDGKEKPLKATVFLVDMTAGGRAGRFTTADDGLFFFSELEPNTTYYLVARALDKKEKITIRVLQNGVGYNPLVVTALRQARLRAANPVAPNAAAMGLQRRVAGNDKKAAEDLLKKLPGIALDDMGMVKAAGEQHLNDVVVVGYGTQKRKEFLGAVAVVNAKDIMPGVKVENALEGRAAGLMIDGTVNPLNERKIAIRGTRTIGGGQPLFVLDGVPLEQFNLNTLNPDDIESIIVLKDAAATAIYGGRAAYGVIMIESRKYRNEKIKIHTGARQSWYAAQYIRAGGAEYAVARNFYAPKYFSTFTSERTDFRETIYWNPVVQTDRNGNAELEFYNSDASTTFRAIAEGIGYNGKPGRAEYTYSAQNATSVDAKIPPYLTVGDKALIPLVIKNNRAQSIELSIRVKLPENLNAGDYPGNIVLAPDSSQQVLIPVEATKALSGLIQFTVENSFGKETLVLPIVANDKGFPIIQTFSGNKSAGHDFSIDKMIPGTLQARLKLFTNLEGQLLDGIESMLREPSGCFEQTSSSTYPNIFVLKYLRASGKSNPEIEKKALQYIEDGYKRLVGYETAQNGFEWFGHTPPHEALTAYGLLEFTDMQEFIDVDKQMLTRTKNFLMSRRDGKGSFLHASGGYDQFASVPDKIADIYIVYALTQAGIGREIKPEYDATVKKALAGNDGYQLAMMALAASNMKNEADYNQLMDALSNQYQKLKLAAETSVVNSRDASLRVETMSLYALALMRKPSNNMGLVAELISKILGEKTYYGYGATQATVLALQAIVEYSTTTGKISKEAKINFTLNDQPLDNTENLLPGLKEGRNSFAVQYADDAKTVPYNLEVSYNTLTPPNSEKAELALTTRLANSVAHVGETVRMEIEVTNKKSTLQPMAIAKIGIPAGLSVQPWQLKEIMEKNQAAYYEIFDNYLVFYWMGFKAGETKKIALDLKAEIAGTYRGKASNVYLYYTPEYKNWNDGVDVEIRQ